MFEDQQTNLTKVYGGAFKPGFDPRRHVGAPAIDRSFTRYLNELGLENEDGTAKYPVSELKRIIKDTNSPHPKVMACEEILRARSKGYDKQGRIPKAANSLERMCDRTVGKPVQSVVVAQVDVVDLDQKRLELMAILDRNPALLKSFGLRRLLPEGLEDSLGITSIIDTDADVWNCRPNVADESRFEHTRCPELSTRPRLTTKSRSSSSAR